MNSEAKLPIVKELSLIVGNNVRELRLKRGWSQPELAEKLNMALGTVYKIEQGIAFPRKATLDAIAKVFGIDLETLLSRSQSANLPTQNAEIAIREYQKQITDLTKEIGKLEFQLEERAKQLEKSIGEAAFSAGRVSLLEKEIAELKKKIGY